MTNDFLKKHAEELQQVARRTSERAAKDPGNFWLSVTAENQCDAADEAIQQLGLPAVTEADSYDEIIDGVISGIFETGRLDIRTKQGRVRVRFSEDQTPEVQRLAIATRTVLQVRTTRYTDPVTHKDIFKRQLLQRRDLGLIAE